MTQPIRRGLQPRWGRHHVHSECFTRKRRRFGASTRNCSGGDPFQKSRRCFADCPNTSWASSCRICTTRRRASSNHFPMRSHRSNPVWKCRSAQHAKSKAKRIAFSLWDGCGAAVRRHPRQCAKWFRKKAQVKRDASSSTRCLQEVSGSLAGIPRRPVGRG
jgi:hypothetical protein